MFIEPVVPFPRTREHPDLRHSESFFSDRVADRTRIWAKPLVSAIQHVGEFEFAAFELFIFGIERNRRFYRGFLFDTHRRTLEPIDKEAPRAGRRLCIGDNIMVLGFPRGTAGQRTNFSSFRREQLRGSFLFSPFIFEPDSTFHTLVRVFFTLFNVVRHLVNMRFTLRFIDKLRKFSQSVAQRRFIRQIPIFTPAR